jgi:hypothetical protein
MGLRGTQPTGSIIYTLVSIHYNDKFYRIEGVRIYLNILYAHEVKKLTFVQMIKFGAIISLLARVFYFLCTGQFFISLCVSRWNMNI